MEKKSTHRIDKLNSLIQQVVGESIQEYTKGGPGIVSVSKVETSKDARWAKVWISVLGGDDDAIMRSLNHHLYDIQGRLNRSMTIKMVPRLQLFLDTSGRYAAHINELLDHLHDDDKQNNDPKSQKKI